MSILKKIKIQTLAFPDTQYYKEEFRKKQVCLHHTASGRGMDGDYRHWLNTPERIATCGIIQEDGIFGQCFSSRYWAHHLGLKGDPRNLTLNRHTIGAEIDNWGPLVDYQGKYFSYTGTEVPKERVQVYTKPFKAIPASIFFSKIGVQNKPAYLYQKYTGDQLETARLLLLLWNETYGIPLDYNEDMWKVSTRALAGEEGIWTHVSYRVDKSDCHPQPELIQMLTELKQ
jgi:hypothetical protein